jgi:hypothetical protein
MTYETVLYERDTTSSRSRTTGPTSPEWPHHGL